MESCFPCPCCGSLEFSGPPGSYEICAICLWEDDALQLEFATSLAGGANGPTLAVAQANYRAFGACEARFRRQVRRPTTDDVRDPGWRPIDPARDTFEDWDADPRRRAPPDSELFYWRPGFWRRH